MISKRSFLKSCAQTTAGILVPAYLLENKAFAGIRRRGNSGVKRKVQQVLWTPESSLIGASLIAWFDPSVSIYSDAGVTPCVNNSTVARWIDRSGSGYVLNGSGVTKPKYLTNIINGFPIVSADGAQNYSLASGEVFSISQPSIVYAVYRCASTSAPMYAYTSNGQFIRSNITTGALSFYAGSLKSSSTGSHVGSYMQVTGYFAGANSFIRLNGSLDLSDNPGTGSFTTLYLLSDGSQTPVGSIAEILFYTGTWNSSEHLKPEAYLKNKYAL